MPITETERTPLQEIVIAPIPAQIIHAAVELRIADRLADGPRSAAQLADAAEAHEPSLRRLLLALTGLGIVAQLESDRFELTETGRPLIDGAPDSMRALFRLLCGPEKLRAWEALVPSVRTGHSAWELAHGMPVFEYYGKHPELAAIFNAAMAEHTRDAAPAIVAAGDFSRFRSVVDVGGGDGTLMTAILEAEPDLEGVVFDVPEALGEPTDRCRFVAGDFFASVPVGADAYLLKQVLHDWPDEPATAILRSCRAAMRPDSRLLILDRMLSDRVGPDDLQPLLVDVLMMVATGGRERTEREFRDLLAAADLELLSVSEALSPFDYRVIEAARP
jgi:O-methyltransferase domain/Dimerisation domain